MKAFKFVVEGQMRVRRLMRTWEMQVEDKCMKVVLRREDTVCQIMWIIGVDLFATRLR